MNKIIAILLLLLGSFSIQAQNGEVVDKIVATVGDNIVLLSDIELQYEQYRTQGGAYPQLKCDLLDELLLEKLFLTQAQKDSIYVGEDEVEQELDRRIRYFQSLFGSQEALEEYYGKSVLELKDEFREDIHKQMLAERMQAKIYQGTTVTPAEVKTFFAEIPEDSLPYFNAEVEIGQIVVKPKISAELMQYAYEKISKIRRDIMDGKADFCFKAAVESDDPGTKDDCGDLGFIQRGEMVKEFEGAAFSTEVGAISEPFQTQYGWHILEVLEKQGEKVHVRHILVSPKVTTSDMEVAVNTLDSIRTLLVNDSITFQKAVEKFSEDQESKSAGGLLINPNTGTSYFEMDEVDNSIKLEVNKMDVGGYSKVVSYQTFDGKTAFRILYLRSETEPHKANLKQDYNKIQAAALQQKQQQVLIDWIIKKKNETYIQIDPKYSSCEVMDKWTNN